MRKKFCVISIILLLISISCDDNENPTQPFDSITEEINEALPVDTITINKGDESSDKFVASHFTKAQAENGFLIIIVNSDNKRYYNLLSAKDINIQPKQKIIIDY